MPGFAKLRNDIMKSNAEVVIVGGGIIGSSIAFHLAKMGMTDVVVLEKDMFIGAGATAKCAGGIRAQFSSEINIKMSLLSENLLERFQEDTGEEGIFDQCGYLFLVTTPEEEETFRRNMALQVANDVPVVWLNPDDIRDIALNVRLDDVLGGTFCEKDGIGDPHVFTHGYANAAKRLGAVFELETEVTDISVEGGKVRGVSTMNGSIGCKVVINAAGPYAAQIGKMVGVELPIEPVKRQISTTSPLTWLPESFPMVVDVSSGLYCHRESGGLLMGWADPDTPAGLDESLDPDYTDEIIMRAIDRIPMLEEAGIATSWAGLYSVTPDHRAILGKIPEIEGFLVAGGFSGHGFMHGPAAGKLIAELVTDGKPSIDLSPLAFERLTEAPEDREKVVI
jgi:sarcosine oxidase subunit beta